MYTLSPILFLNAIAFFGFYWFILVFIDVQNNISVNASSDIGFFTTLMFAIYFFFVNLYYKDGKESEIITRTIFTISLIIIPIGIITTLGYQSSTVTQQGTTINSVLDGIKELFLLCINSLQLVFIPTLIVELFYSRKSRNQIWELFLKSVLSNYYLLKILFKIANTLFSRSKFS